jgi:hypothetical protein
MRSSPLLSGRSASIVRARSKMQDYATGVHHLMPMHAFMHASAKSWIEHIRMCHLPACVTNKPTRQGTSCQGEPLWWAPHLQLRCCAQRLLPSFRRSRTLFFNSLVSTCECVCACECASAEAQIVSLCMHPIHACIGCELEPAATCSWCGRGDCTC